MPSELLTATQQRNIALLLVEMAFNGEIIEVSPGKYKSPQRGNEATGIFVRRSNGKNSVITDADGETIFVAERNSMRAPQRRQGACQHRCPPSRR